MFTIEQIISAQSRAGSGADYPRLIDALKHLGVRRYVHVVAQGTSEFFGDGDHAVRTGPAHTTLAIADTVSKETLQRCLVQHQTGSTDYATFCRQVGEAGVARWTCDLEQMRVSYESASGVAILIEAIPTVP